MMRMRMLFVLTCAVVLVVAASSLWAQAEGYPACCFDKTDCATGLQCCDADSLGRERCASNIPGLCLQACVPADGVSRR